MPHRTPLINALGQAVLDMRTARGLSQEGLADLCGMHRNYVGGIERGERNPTVDVLARLAGGLDVAVSDLFVRAEGHLRS